MFVKKSDSLRVWAYVHKWVWIIPLATHYILDHQWLFHIILSCYFREFFRDVCLCSFHSSSLL